MEEIDGRGKACPHSIFLTQQALERLTEGELTLMVDNGAACENVERFAKSEGCPVTVEQKGWTFTLVSIRENQESSLVCTR